MLHRQLEENEQLAREAKTSQGINTKTHKSVCDQGLGLLLLLLFLLLLLLLLLFFFILLIIFF
jgi:hypothetical protein